jgi:hypothetical protein
MIEFTFQVAIFTSVLVFQQFIENTTNFVGGGFIHGLRRRDFPGALSRRSLAAGNHQRNKRDKDKFDRLSHHSISEYATQ